MSNWPRGSMPELIKSPCGKRGTEIWHNANNLVTLYLYNTEKPGENSKVEVRRYDKLEINDAINIRHYYLFNDIIMNP